MKNIGLTIVNIYVNGFVSFKYEMIDDDTCIIREKGKIIDSFTLESKLKEIESEHKIKSIKISEREDIDKNTWKWSIVSELQTMNMIHDVDKEYKKLMKKSSNMSKAKTSLHEEMFELENLKMRERI